MISKNYNPSAFGLINEPGTQTIFGSGSNRNTFNLGSINGIRLTIGGWIDDSYQYGIEGDGFGFSQTKSSFSASSNGGNIPIINIPFFSTQSSSENVLVNRLPNRASVSDTFQPSNFELNGLYRLQNNSRFPLILLLGFRYMNINEELKLNDAIYNNPSTPHSVLNVRDNFSTNNDFYGLQVGMRENVIYEQLIFNFSLKVALGKVYQKLIIHGQTNLNNQTILQRIGLFAEPTNIGTFKNNQFAILPELEAQMGYHLYKHIYPFITYNFIYINRIIRPGKQIDRRINLSQNILIGGTGVLSGPAAPLARFNSSSLWLQGLSAGIEFNFY